MRTLLLVPGLVMAVVAAAPGGQQAPSEPPDDSPQANVAGGSVTASALEKLRFNPRERTSHGLGSLDNGDAAGAVESFDTAGRLAAEDPLARFNAGTAELMAGAEGSLDHLAFAAEMAPPDLAPAAHFNLGNVHLQGGQPAEAIESYKQSLRLDPTNRDVKHNLELARRMLEKQQEQQQQQEQEQQQQDDQEQQQQQQDQQQQQEEQPQEQQQDQSMPEFEEQPDMTAEQAAAILEAVENLERDERRRQAEERARKRSKKGKDW